MDASRPAPRPGPLRRVASSVRDLFHPPPPSQPPSRVHFFSLPAEIRTLILTAAFGNRTIHIELGPRRPPHRGWVSFPWSKKLQRRRSYHHGGMAHPLANYICDVFKPRQILCWSSVCHHVAPVGDRWDNPGADRRPAALRPGTEDRCLHGEAANCHTWRRTPKARGCDDTIGALGFLLSCREGYRTAIPILYTTNTFFLTSSLLQLILEPTSLPRPLELAPFHLLTSLHLTFSVVLFGSPPCLASGPAHQLDGIDGYIWLQSQLCMLPLVVEQKLPGLRYLSVSFTDLLDQRRLSVRRPRQSDLEIGFYLLRPLANAIMALPERVWEGGRVIVQLPENVYGLLTRGGKGGGLGVALLGVEDGGPWPGMTWAGWVHCPVQDGAGRWVYWVEMYEGVDMERQRCRERRDFQAFEIREGVRSDLVWRASEGKQKSRVKERYPEKWGSFGSVEEYRRAYAKVMRDGGEGEGVDVF